MYRFPNTACVGTSSLNGTCYTRWSLIILDWIITKTRFRLISALSVWTMVVLLQALVRMDSEYVVFVSSKAKRYKISDYFQKRCVIYYDILKYFSCYWMWIYLFTKLYLLSSHCCNSRTLWSYNLQKFSWHLSGILKYGRTRCRQKQTCQIRTRQRDVVVEWTNLPNPNLLNTT